MKQLALSLLALSSMTLAAGTVKLPEPFTCQNTSTGEFLYQIRVATTDGVSTAEVTNEKAVTSLAKKIGVIKAEDPTIFAKAVVASVDPNCEVNDENRFAMRCHPIQQLSLYKKDSQVPTTIPVTFLSLWNIRHIHETPFTTWDEYEVMMGVSLEGKAYTHEKFIIDHPQCG
ncbi:MAG: hypothetical protein HYZ71_16005 [Deltaproteobacteria bacterium]|nr:hypothetical protein [Deltaproteobacteria bacterium]